MTKKDLYKMIDYLIFSNVFWDSKNNRIIYISKTNNDRFLKISVTLPAQKHSPTIDDLSVFDLSADSMDHISDRYSLRQILEMETIQ